MIENEEKNNIRDLVRPLVFVALLVIVLTVFINVQNTLTKNKKTDNDFVYVSKIILHKTTPVVGDNDNETIGLPYNNEKVKQVRGFYNHTSDENSKQNSLIFYDNTYIQNSGLDFKADESFDVISILPGTVTSIKEDNLLGKIVEVKHTNELISVYQSLSDISAKEGQEIVKGEVIGKSGTSNIAKDLDNHLHLELYYKGQVVDPNLFFNKTMKEL